MKVKGCGNSSVTKVFSQSVQSLELDHQQNMQLSVVMHTYNLSTLEIEAAWPDAQGHTWHHSALEDNLGNLKKNILKSYVKNVSNYMKDKGIIFILFFEFC